MRIVRLLRTILSTESFDAKTDGGEYLCRLTLPDPQPIPVRIVEPEFGQAVECAFEIGYFEAAGTDVFVIFHDVVRIQIQHTRTRYSRMHIDRLIDHYSAFSKSQHRPPPLIPTALNAESQLLVKLNASTNISCRQHRY